MEQKVIHKQTGQTFIIKNIRFLTITKGFNITIEDDPDNLNVEEPEQFTFRGLDLDKFYEFFTLVD